MFFFFVKQDKRVKLKEEDKVEGPIWGVTEQMVEQALKSMKVSKAQGPSDHKRRYKGCRSNWSERAFSGL